ncbi:hypothetical protein [Rufibacter sp. DG15C]|uniref:hypothetical protein n=1 Tax=Rufibacter sp. DG15C TaxID=1379909 RepID=UPI000AFF7ECD|nr:hypothetical protein [Rufibacter sp. DG15C]
MTVKTVDRKVVVKSPIEYKVPNGVLIAIGGAESKGSEDEHAEVENHNYVKYEIL